MAISSLLTAARADYYRRKTFADSQAPCGDDTLRRVGEEIRTLADLYQKLKAEHERTLKENAELKREVDKLKAGK
jgi:hypothetical protein